MARFITLGFDDRVIGTLGSDNGKFVATGPDPEQVLTLAAGAAQWQAEEHPDQGAPDPEAVMARMVRTMQGRCHAVWSDADGTPLPDQTS